MDFLQKLENEISRLGWKQTMPTKFGLTDHVDVKPRTIFSCAPFSDKFDTMIIKF